MTTVGPKLTLRARRFFCGGVQGVLSKSTPAAAGTRWVVSTLMFLASARCLPVVVGLESDRLSRGAFGIVAKSSGMLPNDNAIVEADDVDNDVPH